MKKLFLASVISSAVLSSLFAADMQGMNHNMDGNMSSKMGQHCDDAKKQKACPCPMTSDKNSSKKAKKQNSDSNNSAK